MTRKMATVKKIDDIGPIKDADRLEVAKVGGWNIVVPKGEFEAGQKVVYFEIDTFLPESDPAFESFQKRGQKKQIYDGEEIKGHVLRTVKLRGVISQGLVLAGDAVGLEDIDSISVGTDVSDDVGVFKFDNEKPQSGDIIGEFDARMAPKTDAERIQNLAEHWDDIKNLEWEATVKIDGTSQTMFFDEEEDRLRLFSRNWEITPEAEGMKIAERNGLVDFLRENPGAVVQFELAGEGIQSNRLMLRGRHVFVFAVWVDGVKLPRDQWDSRLLKHAAPLLEIKPEGDLEDFIASIDGIRGNISKDRIDEGVVFHLVGDNMRELPVWMDRNANFKVISQKWLLKEK